MVFKPDDKVLLIVNSKLTVGTVKDINEGDELHIFYKNNQSIFPSGIWCQPDEVIKIDSNMLNNTKDTFIGNLVISSLFILFSVAIAILQSKSNNLIIWLISIITIFVNGFSCGVWFIMIDNRRKK